MMAKNKKTNRLTEALLETAKDMNNVGILEEAAYEKITMRHLGMKNFCFSLCSLRALRETRS